MQEKKTRKFGRSQWQLLLLASGMAVVTGGAGYLFGQAAKSWSWVPTGLVTRLDVLTGWDLLVLPLLIVFVLAFHEAGHLAGGMSRGMRFLLFIAGPFAWIRGADGVHFRWFFSLGTFGGLAAALPVPGQELKPQLVRLVLGGPLASLLLAAMAFAAFLWMPGRAGIYGLIVAGTSLAIFVVTALPMRNGGFMSDGMQFLQLRRNPAMVERRVRLMALVGQGMSGTRPLPELGRATSTRNCWRRRSRSRARKAATTSGSGFTATSRRSTAPISRPRPDGWTASSPHSTITPMASASLLRWNWRFTKLWFAAASM